MILYNFKIAWNYIIFMFVRRPILVFLPQDFRR